MPRRMKCVAVSVCIQQAFSHVSQCASVLEFLARMSPALRAAIAVAVYIHEKRKIESYKKLFP